MPKLTVLLESNDPHTIVQLSTSEDELKSPSVNKLYDEKEEAPVDG